MGILVTPAEYREALVGRAIVAARDAIHAHHPLDERGPIHHCKCGLIFEGDEAVMQHCAGEEVRAALAVVETATVTCETCGDAKTVTENVYEGYGNVGEVDVPCPSCRGVPGPLLVDAMRDRDTVLRSLGGDHMDTHEPFDPQDKGEVDEWWFPRQPVSSQDGQP